MSLFTVSSASRSRRRRVADELAALLAREGVSTIFGIPGGAISPLNDALLAVPSVETFVTRHESEAVWAASGHALVRGTPGVVFVTSGPGITNALTGLASAKCDRVPLVIFAGEVPRAVQGKGALQDGSAHALDVRSSVRSLAKAVIEIAEPRTALVRVAQAFRVAREEVPGPVVVLLPLDVLLSEVPQCEVSFAHKEARVTFDQGQLQSIHERLVDEPRPLLFVGSGMRGCGRDAATSSAAMIRAFAERYCIPVVTSPKAKGMFPESHRLSLGVFGLGGHPSATSYVEAGIGTLLAIGTGLGDLATDGQHPALKPERALIHVDVDAAALGRSYPTTTSIVGPAHEFLEAMLTIEMRDAPMRPRRSFGVVKHEAPSTKQHAQSEALIPPDRAVAELQRALPPDTLFVLDAGEHWRFAMHYLTLDGPDQLITLSGLGSMGASIGTAIGAQLADRDRTVCVIIGDGGMTMVGLDLLDAVAHGLPLVVAVMNDRRLGMCEIGHANVYGRTPDFSVPALDLSAFAAAIGARSHVMSRPGDIDAIAPALAARVRHGPRPVLLDVRVDPAIVLPKRDRIGALAARGRAA